MKKVVLLIPVLILILPLVLGAAHNNEELKLPPGLQKINAYNEDVAQQYVTTATIFIAFLAGILTLFSPCILPLLPAFFSYSFGTKKETTKMTLLFFLGFSLMFTAIALGAVFLGTNSTAMFQTNTLGIYTRIIGALLMLVGAAGMLGLGFGGPKVTLETKRSGWGVFLYGLLFAIGWTACVGPILSGVILMASIFQNYFFASLLILFYSLGIFVPLLLLAVFWDKRKLGGTNWLTKKVYEHTLLGKKRTVSMNGIIAGILFLLLGALFLFTGGTSLINGTDPFGTKMLFYQWQPILLENPALFNTIGVIALLVVASIVIWGVRRKK